MFTLSKEEALKFMQEGHKVRHRYFSEDEYIYIKDGKMYTEEGYRFEEGWELRNNETWQSGWEVVKEESKTIFKVGIVGCGRPNLAELSLRALEMKPKYIEGVK